jgi:hypothetical protein
MNKISRTVSGAGVLLLSCLMLWSVVDSGADFFTLLWVGGWALLLLGIAVYLFLNDQEDEIEDVSHN